MSILRQFNSMGQMRIDVPHLRSIESSIAADFDVLVGRSIAGERPFVVRGFSLSNTTIGTVVTDIQLVTANSIAYNINASEAGSFLWIPSDRAPEQLNSANAKIVGSFTSSAVNYIGIDFNRDADSSTADLAQFLDANTLQETGRNVALGRTLDYQIIISTAPFSTATNVIPIAKVTVSATNTITAIEDARQMLYRLGSGGDFPNYQSSYVFPFDRTESLTTDIFNGGDKNIQSQKDWMDATMTSLWELRGGSYWYSQTNRDNVKAAYGPVSVLLDNWVFDTSGSPDLLKWENVKLVFENSDTGIYYNTVTDNTAGISFDTNGLCLYVDLVRESNATVVAAVANLSTLSGSTIPGRRIILAWRVNNNVYVRDRQYEVGRAIAFSGTPVAVTPDASPSQGSSGFSARVDHQHGIVTYASAPVASDASTASAGTSGTAPARGDHKHSITVGTPVVISDVATSAGVATSLARSDHQHGISTGTPVAISPDTAAGAGVATSLARSDHQHGISTYSSTPAAIGTASAGTSGTAPARGDHVHAHGNQAGGTLHSVATTSVAGFMSAADKIKLYSTAKNLVINGNFEINQRGSGVFNSALTRTFVSDRWYIKGNASSVSGQVQSVSFNEFTKSFRITASDGGTHYIAQEIERESVILSRGRPLFVTFYAKYTNSGAPGTTTAKLVYGTGSSSENYSTGYTGQTTAGSSVIALTGSFQKFTLSVSSLSASATTLAFIVEGNNWNITAGIEITGVTLSNDTEEVQFFSLAGGNMAGELAICQRYYEKSYNIDVAPQTVTLDGAHATTHTVVAGAYSSAGDIYLFGSHPTFKVVKRVTPTVTLYNYYSGLASEWQYGLLGSATNFIVNAGEISDRGFFAVYYSPPTPAATAIWGHWVADAEI